MEKLWSHEPDLSVSSDPAGLKPDEKVQYAAARSDEIEELNLGRDCSLAMGSLIPWIKSLFFAGVPIQPSPRHVDGSKPRILVCTVHPRHRQGEVDHQVPNTKDFVLSPVAMMVACICDVQHCIRDPQRRSWVH